jgi:hypothetical protein
MPLKGVPGQEVAEISLPPRPYPPFVAKTPPGTVGCHTWLIVGSPSIVQEHVAVRNQYLGGNAEAPPPFPAIDYYDVEAHTHPSWQFDVGVEVDIAVGNVVGKIGTHGATIEGV